MSAGPLVREMAAGEEPLVTGVLADAFQRETLAIWIEPDPVLRRESFRILFHDLLKGPAEGRVVDVTTDHGAAAIWYSPGAAPPPVDGPAHPEAAALFAEVESLKPPGPYWYLAFLGAAARARGGGGALLRHRLHRVEGRAALWTASPANLGYYARFGFEVHSRTRLAGPTAWWLTRAPEAGVPAFPPTEE